MVMGCASAVVIASDTSDVAARIRAKEAQRQYGEFSHVGQSNSGKVKFDYSKNSGRFTVVGGNKVFLTQWSACGRDAVHVYRAKGGLIGYNKGYSEFPANVEEFEKAMDFSSKSAPVSEGEVAVLINTQNQFMAVRVLSVKTKSRGDDEDCVEFEYKVY